MRSKGGGGGTWRSFVSLPEGLENPWTTEWPLMPTFDSMMAIKKYSWVIISKRIEAVTMCFGSRNWNLRRWAKHVCIDLESRWRWDWGKSPTGFIQNEAFFRPKMVILLRRMMVNYHWWGTIEFWGTRTQNPCPKLSEFTQSARSFASCRFEHGRESWSVLKLAPWTCFGTMKCTVAQGKQSQLTWLLEVIFCIGNHYNYLKINHYNFLVIIIHYISIMKPCLSAPSQSEESTRQCLQDVNTKNGVFFVRFGINLYGFHRSSSQVIYGCFFDLKSHE